MVMRKILDRFRGSAKPKHIMEDEFFECAAGDAGR